MKGHLQLERKTPMSKPTIQEAVNPLRQRMLQDMAIRGLREHTQHDYIRVVRSFASFLRRSPGYSDGRGYPRSTTHELVEPEVRDFNAETGALSVVDGKTAARDIVLRRRFASFRNLRWATLR
jgi:hypothetical protein